MFFPAGIPLVAVVALIIWNARQQNAAPKAAAKPASGSTPRRGAAY
jgi:hypothetical protein